MTHTEIMTRLLDDSEEPIRYLVGQVCGLQFILSFILSSLTKNDDLLRDSIRKALVDWATLWANWSDDIPEGDSRAYFTYGIHHSFVDAAGNLVDPPDLDLFGDIISDFDPFDDSHNS